MMMTMMTDKTNLSQSEEMYLLAIMQACEYCTDTPIPIPDIADSLNVQPVSVNQMVKKLANEGLVSYLPYKGVQLTTEGTIIATKILRHRRLWEIFLVKHLHLDLEQADAIACHIEHHTTERMGQRLSEFLDHPSVCYHGKPIPHLEGNQPRLNLSIPLAQLELGQAAPIMEISTDEITSRYLNKQGLRPGVRVKLMAIGSKGDFLLESDDGRLQITKALAEEILVSNPNISTSLK